MERQKIKYVINLSWILLSAVLLSSCIRDRYPEMENATVQVTFMTKAISDPTSDPGGLENHESMQTLRVIVAQGKNVIYNLFYDSFETAKDAYGRTYKFKTITVNDLDVGSYDFYAIANEEGTGYVGDWNDITTSDINLSESVLNKLNDGQERTLIPQTAHSIINVAPQGGGGMQSETIQLQFAVAKVRMTVINTSTDQQTVSNIILSGVNTKSTPLFSAESISQEAEGSVGLGSLNVSAMTNEGTATVYAYFFENENTSVDDGYKLTAYWGSVNRTLDLKTEYGITKIPRGTELDIRVTLSKNVEPSFNISVIPWDERDIEVPEFK